jgi:hypothetical protein
MPGGEAHVKVDLLENESVADAGDSGHGAAQSESEHYDSVDVDPHKSGRVGVLRDRAHRRSHLRALDRAHRRSHLRALNDDVEDRHRDERGRYHHDLEDWNAGPENGDGPLLPFWIRIGSDSSTKRAAKGLFEKERHADRAD